MEQLYRIMIVDDEEEAREGIAKRVNWNKLGFEVAATAENGADALEKAESLDLDVVLSDIKMPYMDGLEMGRRLKKMCPAIRLLLLTGFDEFEYAREAISLEVVEFILKPVNESELSAIMTRVKAALDEDVAQKKNVDVLRAKYENSLPLLREHFLNELVWGVLSPSDVREQIASFGLPLAGENKKTVAVLDIDYGGSAASGMSRELIPISVKQTADELCAGHFSYLSFISAGAVVLIFCHDRRGILGEIMTTAGEICNECRRISAISVTAGVGRAHSDPANLHRSYSDALEAVEYRAVEGMGSAIYIQDVESEEAGARLLDAQVEKRLLTAVKFGGDREIGEVVETLVSRISGDGGEWERQTELLGVFGVLASLMQRYEVDEKEVFGEEARRFIRLETDFTPEELRAWLNATCLRLGCILKKRRTGNEEKLIDEAKRYIADSYADSQLSLDTLCEHLHISASYFSALFKRVTGQSYVGYLTETRLQKARDLLENTDNKTYLVAGSVGYDEPNYFSYVFKKRFGKSPSQYRAQLKDGGRQPE